MLSATFVQLSVVACHLLKMLAMNHAGKAAKFLGKLGQKIARNVYSEAIEPSQAYSRSAVDLGAVCLLLCT